MLPKKKSKINPVSTTLPQLKKTSTKTVSSSPVKESPKKTVKESPFRVFKQSGFWTVEYNGRVVYKNVSKENAERFVNNRK